MQKLQGRVAVLVDQHKMNMSPQERDELGQIFLIHLRTVMNAMYRIFWHDIASENGEGWSLVVIIEACHTFRDNGIDLVVKILIVAILATVKVVQIF